MMMIAATAGMLAQTDLDSAEQVVARYYSIMGYDHLPHNKMLYLETQIVSTAAQGDTALLRRWFALPNSYRIELWQDDTLREGWHNDEQLVFRKYDAKKRQWIKASQMHYYDNITGYDFRGPLYRRKTNGSVMVYGGLVSFEGHAVHKVMVSAPEMYDRDYLFEKESGLLFLYIEHETAYGNEEMNAENHVDWRSIEEYLPVGPAIVVSRETYQHNGYRTTLIHKPQLLPTDRSLFAND